MKKELAECFHPPFFILFYQFLSTLAQKQGHWFTKCQPVAPHESTRISTENKAVGGVWINSTRKDEKKFRKRRHHLYYAKLVKEELLGKKERKRV